MTPLPRAAAPAAIRVEIAGQAIHGFLHRPSEDPHIPCVILCHGLMSSMESPKFRILADGLCQAGMAAVRFDFRGCGASEGSIRESTVSGRVRDLEAILCNVREGLGYLGPLGLLGSSMGGYVSLIVFARRRDIRALCVWATPFDVGGLADLRDHPDLSALGPDFFADLKRRDLVSRHSWRSSEVSRPPPSSHARSS